MFLLIVPKHIVSCSTRYPYSSLNGCYILFIMDCCDEYTVLIDSIVSRHFIIPRTSNLKSKLTVIIKR